MDAKAFEFAALPLWPTPSGRITVIDEIGKMEAFSGQFMREAETLLESNETVLATIAAFAGGPIRALCSRFRDHITEVTKANRDGLPEILAEKLRKAAETP